jgi:CRP-like cAMP-binding protein
VNQTIDAIGRIPYLRNLSRADREALARVCEIRRVPDGARLFSEGVEPKGIFLILDGRVRLVRSSSNGREQVLHEEGAGATLGEVPVFDGAGYVASAVAVGDVTVCFVPRPALLDVLERNPASASAVIQVLAARLRKFAALVEDLSLRAVGERLAEFLVREAEASGAGELQLPPTRDQLAAHLGTVREQVSRALSDLKREGIIMVDGRRVRILDVERLKRCARRTPPVP